MSGLIAYIGSERFLDPTAPAVAEVSGDTVDQWREENCQLVMKSPAKPAGYECLETGKVRVDIHGDIFSLKDETENPPDFASLLVEKYLQNRLQQILPELNGYFILSIYDKQKARLTLASDRFGIKPLYLWIQDKRLLGFASELKAIALHPAFEQRIDSDAMDTFIDLGHMLGEQTWFKNVSRIKPASSIEIDLKSQTFWERQYWRWGRIQKRSGISLDEAVDQLYHHFNRAMFRCLSSIRQPNLAITLSGGLDSRVLLASAKEIFAGEIDTYTFGQAGCDDAVIAKQASQIAGVPNHFREMNGKNWFEGRERGIWLTDGMFNVLHMHTLASVDRMALRSNYLLNGYLGDAVLGGGYMSKNIDDKPSFTEQVTRRFGRHAGHSDYKSDYYAFHCIDPVFIYNRGVRFIATGTDLLTHKLHNLKPFMDNDLLEFTYSLPDGYRRYGVVYHRMLLKYFPDYFETIPWQNTGKVITGEPVDPKPAAQPQGPSIRERLVNLIKGTPIENIARKLYGKFKRKDLHSYAAYADWIREDAFKKKSIEMLQSQQSYVRRFLTRERVDRLLDDFYIHRKIAPDVVGSLSTIEFYFRQLANKRE